MILFSTLEALVEISKFYKKKSTRHTEIQYRKKIVDGWKNGKERDWWEMEKKMDRRMDE